MGRPLLPNGPLPPLPTLSPEQVLRVRAREASLRQRARARAKREEARAAVLQQDASSFHHRQTATAAAEATHPLAHNEWREVHSTAGSSTPSYRNASVVAGAWCDVCLGLPPGQGAPAAASTTISTTKQPTDGPTETQPTNISPLASSADS
ncbi:unnamed protein product [Ectocarpus fasciculatus]